MQIREASRRGEDDPQTMYAVAELLTTAPVPSLRDTQGALRAARRAIELRPEGGGYWKILGLAHYRAGDWDAAIEAVNKGTEVRGTEYRLPVSLYLDPDGVPNLASPDADASGPPSGLVHRHPARRRATIC